MSKSKFPTIKSKYWRLEIYPTKEQLQELGAGQDYDGSDGYGTVPDDWKKILDDSLIPYAISPLHDRDKHPDGRFKKPHYHVLLVYPTSNTTLKAVYERICQPLNSPWPLVADNPRGAYDYLVHKNAPEKYQYEGEPELHNGFSVTSSLPASEDEILQIKWNLICESAKRGIKEYADLVDFVGTEYGCDSEEFKTVSNNTVFFNAYMTSKRNKIKQLEVDAENAKLKEEIKEREEKERQKNQGSGGVAPGSVEGEDL